jgi:hypothetical protein
MLIRLRAWRLRAASAAKARASLPSAWRDARFVWVPSELTDEAVNRP